MAGNRMSSLPVAQYCGHTQDHNIGSGRAAAMGTAYHALCHAPDAPETKAALMRLTPEETEEVMTWPPPSDVTLHFTGWKRTLSYRDAKTEVRVGLTDSGAYCEYDDPKAITNGHVDFFWGALVEGYIFVGDLKKGRFTSDPDSLQLAAYGMALADKYDAEGYVPGIWAAEDAEWIWGRLVTLGTREALDKLERIRHAAKNQGGDYARGAHCRSCYSRWQCPAHVMSPEWALGSLKPLAKPLEATPEEWARLLLDAQAAKETAEAVIEQAKDYAAAFGPLYDGDKMFTGVKCKGRASLDKAALGKVVDLSQYEKRGADYEQFRWVNRK